MAKRKNASAAGNVPADTKIPRSNTEAANSASQADTLDPASMRSLAECPICLEIPRDGVMLQCLNGHNLCATCKDKIGEGATCPQGRCPFNTPPAKNFTVGNIIERCPFEWPCKYQKEADCAFKGTKSALLSHEAECEKTLISCPDFHCKEKTSLTKVVEHFANVHKRAAEYRNTLRKIFLLKDGSKSGSAWPEDPCTLSSVDWALLCSHWHEGQLFIWMWALLDEEQAGKLECKFYVGDTTYLVDKAPVYPLTWDRQKVMGDDRCVRLGAWSFNRMISDDVTEEQKGEGYSSHLKVYFQVSTKVINETHVPVLSPIRRLVSEKITWKHMHTQT